MHCVFTRHKLRESRRRGSRANSLELPLLFCHRHAIIDLLLSKVLVCRLEQQSMLEIYFIGRVCIDGCQHKILEQSR